MASPKSVKMGSAVAPAEPGAAKDADNATTGQASSATASQREIEAGEVKQTKIEPFREEDKANASEEAKQTWIALELVDDDGKPIPGEPYAVTLPDGKVASGTTDEKGCGRVECFEPGQCKISFPKIDKDGWESA